MEDKVLLKIARESIASKFDDSISIDKDSLYEKYPKLKKTSATFVTLNLNGELRGCIGSLVGHRSLLEDLISNAKAAAFEDPRFYVLSKEEFEKVDIELSILSEPKVLNYSNKEDLKAKIKPNIHGVILQKDGRKATFLPQVWEQLPSFELFFSHLCQKAGLSPNCIDTKPQIYTYEAKKIK